MLMDDRRSPRRLGLQPILVDDRPQQLIQVLAIAKERLPQHALAPGAELAQRAVAAAVQRRRTRFQPMNPDDQEPVVERQRGAVEERACAPELAGEREAPFGRSEVRLERANLHQPDRNVGGPRHDRVADVLPRGALAMRPRDEPLEAFHRRRRRRDEACDLRGRQRGEQRWRVRQPQLAKRHQRTSERRQPRTPVGRGRNTCRQRHRRNDGLELGALLKRHLLHQKIFPDEITGADTRLSPAPTSGSAPATGPSTASHTMFFELNEPQRMLVAATEPQTMLSPSNVPQTMLSPANVPQTMLSPTNDPHTMLSPSSEPHTM